LETEAEIKRVREFVADGNYHAAYNIALSAMNACRRAGDQDGVDDCIDLIREIVAALADEFGSRRGA
jgi:hypothetical protein